MTRTLMLACAALLCFATGCPTQLKMAVRTEAGALQTVGSQLSTVDGARLRACTTGTGTNTDCDQVAKAVASDLDLQAKALNDAAARLNAAAQ